MRTIRPRTILAPFAAGCLATLALLLATYALAAADSGGAPAEDAVDVARWWRSGQLAGPIALALYGILAIGVVLSRTRWPGIGWLRRGRVQATIAVVAANLSATVLPAAVAGTLTMPMLWSAIASLGLLAVPGGMEHRAEGPPT